MEVVQRNQLKLILKIQNLQVNREKSFYLKINNNGIK